MRAVNTRMKLPQNGFKKTHTGDCTTFPVYTESPLCMAACF